MIIGIGLLMTGDITPIILGCILGTSVLFSAVALGLNHVKKTQNPPPAGLFQTEPNATLQQPSAAPRQHAPTMTIA